MRNRRRTWKVGRKVRSGGALTMFLAVAEKPRKLLHGYVESGTGVVVIATVESHCLQFETTKETAFEITPLISTVSV